MIKSSSTYVSRLLTNQSLAYRNENYIADEIMPTIVVKKDTAKILSYSADNLRIVETVRAQGAKSKIVNHSISMSDFYSLEEHALSEYVSLEEYENADQPIEPQRDAMENLIDILSVVKEKSLSDNLSNTSVVTNNTTLSGTDQWSDYSNSDPIGDIQAAIDTVADATLKEPNTLVFGRSTFNTLIHHPDLIARAQGAVVVTADVVIALLKTTFPSIEKVLVGRAGYNSTKEGQSASLSRIWGKNAWVMYIESNPRLKSRSFGFTYRRKANREIEVYPMSMDSELSDRKSDKIRVSDKYDQKILDVNCAYLIKNAIA